MKKMERLPTADRGKPTIPAKISSCGEVPLGKDNGIVAIDEDKRKKRRHHYSSSSDTSSDTNSDSYTSDSDPNSYSSSPYDSTSKMTG